MSFRLKYTPELRLLLFSFLAPLWLHGGSRTQWERPMIDFKWEQLCCSSTGETKLLYLSSLVCYVQVIGGECWSCFWQGGLLSSKKQFAFGKGKKAKVLLGCGVLAVIWVIWMKRNRNKIHKHKIWCVSWIIHITEQIHKHKIHVWIIQNKLIVDWKQKLVDHASCLHS